jgi:hypothetical protein
MMTIHCDECQHEIHSDLRTLHSTCLHDLLIKIDLLEARIEELEERFAGGTLFTEQ